MKGWWKVAIPSFLLGAVLCGALALHFAARSGADLNKQLADAKQLVIDNAKADAAGLRAIADRLGDSQGTVQSITASIDGRLSAEADYRKQLGGRDAEIRRLAGERDSALGRLNDILTAALGGYPEAEEAIGRLEDFSSRAASEIGISGDGAGSQAIKGPG